MSDERNKQELYEEQPIIEPDIMPNTNPTVYEEQPIIEPDIMPNTNPTEEPEVSQNIPPTTAVHDVHDTLESIPAPESPIEPEIKKEAVFTIDQRELAAILSFDNSNPPYGYVFAKQEFKRLMDVMKEVEQSEQEKVEQPKADTRTEPHSRLVIIKNGEQDLQELARKTAEELAQIPRKEEPEVALVDKDNMLRKVVPLHEYLDEYGVDNLIKLMDEQGLSVQHSAFPEACYSRLEDGSHKVEFAYSGSLYAGEYYDANRTDEITIHNAINRDELAIDEVTRSGVSQAKHDEHHEAARDMALARADAASALDRTDTASSNALDLEMEDPNVEHGDSWGPSFY